MFLFNNNIKFIASTLYLINFINGLAKGRNSRQRHGSCPYLWPRCPLIRLVATQPKSVSAFSALKGTVGGIQSTWSSH